MVFGDRGQQIENRVPYEDGDFCVYYACRDAVEYFVENQLTVDDRTRIKNNQIRRHGFELNLENREYLILDVKQVLDELEKYSIYPKKIIRAPNWINAFGKFNFPTRKNLSFQKGNARFPAIIFSSGAKYQDAHAWFCPSTQKFDELGKIHMSGKNYIDFCIQLEKR